MKNCACCGNTVRPAAPSPLWKLALLGAYGVMVVLVIGSSLLGLGILGMLPVLLLAGLGVIPPLHDLAFREPTCPACFKVMAPETAPGKMAHVRKEAYAR